MKLDVISASAGTGKTYTLAKRLFEELDADRVRPEGVVAITFTVKAARELESRIRRRLLGGGKPALAARVRDGYIGTIHAVCQRLAREHALEAGLSPFLEPVPEAERRKLLAQARARVLRGREARLAALAERLEVEDWSEPLREIVDAARQNGITPADLRASAERSRDGLLRLLGTATLDERAYLAGLRSTLDALLPALETDAESSKAARDRLAAARRLRAALARGDRPTWKAQVQLADAVGPKKLSAAADPFRAHVARHLECAAFHEGLLAFQREIFDVAAETLDAFAREKAEARVLDFGDMLALAHDLLQRPAVQASLRDRLDLVLVDEVQDTSPLQLAVVTALGALARRSIWVGDRKQAIFGFQGSDPELMSAAVESALGGRPPEILGVSYRSRPALVELASDVFADAFAAQGMPREQVVLSPEKADPPALASQPPLACWRWTGGRARNGAPAPTEPHAIAEAIEQLLAAEPPRLVRERVEGGVDRVRPATARDVAVLAYRNSRCSEIATALRLRGIPARVATGGLSDTPEGRLARAAVALLADPRDGIAALEVSWISGTGARDPDGWLSRHIATYGEWRRCKADADAAGTAPPPRPAPFADDPRVEALRAAAPEAAALSPSEALDLALRAGGLPALVRSWPHAAQALANLESLRAEARAYEQLCAARRTAATAIGLVDHLARLADEGDEQTDRQAMPTAEDAVTVSTWHRAKGLEWPIVILSELDHQRERSVFDVTTVAAPSFRLDAPLDGRWVRFWPWPYGGLSSGLALASRAAELPEGIEAAGRERREQLRLSYVGFTRARDLLGFVAEVGREGPKARALDVLCEASASPPLPASPPAARGERRGAPFVNCPDPLTAARGERRGAPFVNCPDPLTAARGERRGAPFVNCPDPLTAARGERSEARKRRLAIPFDARPGPAEVEAGGKRWACLAGELFGLPPGTPAAPTGAARWYAGGAPCTAPREIVNPSAEPLAVAARLVGVTPLGERATLASAPDMQAVGDAVHAFLAADAGADPAARREMAARLLEAHGVAGALAPGTLVAASDALRAWADARFPGATWHREWPLRARLDGPPPRLLVGEADLVLELSDGFALVDHKSFPGGAAERDRRVVEEYAAQLAWYAGALERALRRPLRGAFVHFPLRGEIAEVELGGSHRSW